VICVASTGFASLRTAGAQLLRLPTVLDARGSLVWGETGAHLPFSPRRFWCIYDVPPGQTRGNHGHRVLHEVLICLRGGCTVILDDGADRDEVVLDAADVGLHIPPLIWNTQHLFSPDAVLLVLASEVYRAEDYIRDYDEFLTLVAQPN
jgi:UDP-2-acetamido-3-amino-2,3-dideoxy-glucuronate N-acetyltransferase